MKQVLTFAFLILISLAGNAQAKDTTAPKVYTLKGTLQDFYFLLSVIDNPDKALHKDVKALEAWITEEIKKQTQTKEVPKKSK